MDETEAALRQLLTASELVAIYKDHEGKLTVAGRRFRETQNAARAVLGLPLREIKDGAILVHSGTAELDVK